MRRFRMAACLVSCICAVTILAGETTITKTKKTPLGGGQIEIEVEGTNKLDLGEDFAGWTPVLLKPNGQVVPVGIVEFTPPVPGGNPTQFKFRYVVTNPQADKGDWQTRTSIAWKDQGKTGQHVSKTITIPIP